MASERLRARINALRAKTTAAGCTEAEALAAAETAARLMREYGLCDDELEITDARAAEPTERATWRTPLAGTIAHCTNTAVIILPGAKRGEAEILFVGREPGPEIAVYLRDVCFRAVAAELRTFKAGAFYRNRRTLKTKRQAAGDFVAGLVARLRRRLKEIFGAAIDAGTKAQAQAVLDQRFTDQVAHRPPARSARYVAAANMGWNAGGNVALNHGVGAAPRHALRGPDADPA